MMLEEFSFHKPRVWCCKYKNILIRQTLTAQNSSKTGSVAVKIIRDGVVWKEATSQGANSIAIVSGCLP
jgi:hypothetical protein